MMAELLKYREGVLPINKWAQDDRPREKLVLKGRSSLSDAELLAILITSGTREESAVDLSKKILALAGNNLNELASLSVSDFRKIRGIGEAKAITIAAALELGRRRKQESAPQRKRIGSSRDCYEYFKPYLLDLKHEEFWILFVNRANKVISHRRVSEGGVSSTIVDTKLIYKYAVEALATSIVLCHNHPSGNALPSPSDIRLTSRLKEAGKVLEITILDHIIFCDHEYYSFLDKNIL